MAGTLTGSIEHYFTHAESNRDCFATIVRFFDNHAQMTRIASQKGFAGSYGGTGDLAGYNTDTNRSGNNAFGVWRWDKVNGDKVYLLLQHTYSGVIGSSPGDPGAGYANYGVFLSAAMDTSGGDCWNGGIADGLADRKGGRFSGSIGVGPVWVANGGTLLVWPRGNGPGGTYNTNKECLACVGSYGLARFHILADDDQLLFLYDYGNDGSYNIPFFFGPYLHHTGITAGVGDYVMLVQDSTASMPWNTDYGSTGGTSNFEGGAVVGSAYGCRTVRCGGIAHMDNTEQSPNLLIPAYDINDMFLRMRDTTSPARYGFFGKVDPAFLAYTTNAYTHSLNSTKTRMVAGSGTKDHTKWVVPWDGVTIPGTGLSQTGVQF